MEDAGGIEEAARLIEKSDYMTALTGAGISAESGIPTFRGKDGLWNKYRPEELATPQAFATNPQLVWEWYAWRMRIMFDAKPNYAHEALAELERLGILKAVITQNVDDLHERAGSKNVLHLHGSLRVVRCVECNREAEVSKPPPVPPLPRCECGGLLRPGVVWFGEMLPRHVLEKAFGEVEKSDVILVVGTSAVVQPAASLPLIVKRRGGAVIEINPSETPLTSISDCSVRMPAGEAMRGIMELLSK